MNTVRGQGIGNGFVHVSTRLAFLEKRSFATKTIPRSSRQRRRMLTNHYWNRYDDCCVIKCTIWTRRFFHTVLFSTFVNSKLISNSLMVHWIFQIWSITPAARRMTCNLKRDSSHVNIVQTKIVRQYVVRVDDLYSHKLLTREQHTWTWRVVARNWRKSLK